MMPTATPPQTTIEWRPATEPGSEGVAGWEMTCTCEGVISVSVSLIVCARMSAEHLAWHEAEAAR